MAFIAPFLSAIGGAAGSLSTAQVISLGLTAASAASSINSNNEAAAMESAAARNNARYNEMRARDAITRGLHEEEDHRLKVRQFLGTQRARFGASGVDLSGSALSVLADTAQLGEQDAIRIANNAAREAFGYETERYNDILRGKAARRTARARNRGTLLTSGADAYGIWKEAS